MLILDHSKAPFAGPGLRRVPRQGDYDVISCFGNCDGVEDYTDAGELFTAAKFNEVQKAAYLAARREYYNRERDNL